MNLMKKYRVRRARKHSRDLSYEEAAELFNGLVMFEIDVDLGVLAEIAERASAAAPTPQETDRYRAYRNALRAGHRVKVGTYPVYTAEGWAT